MTQPLTAKATERELSLPVDNKSQSDSSDDTHKNLGECSINNNIIQQTNTHTSCIPKKATYYLWDPYNRQLIMGPIPKYPDSHQS